MLVGPSLFSVATSFEVPDSDWSVTNIANEMSTIALIAIEA
jgi:hypothetical protein